GPRIARIGLEPARFLATEGEAQMPARQELDILADQLRQPTPDLARPVGERELRQEPALAADIAEIRPARVLPDQVALQQDHRQTALAEEEGRRRAHDPATDDDHVRRRGSRRHARASSATGSGFTGAAPRKRPTT